MVSGALPNPPQRANRIAAAGFQTSGKSSNNEKQFALSTDGGRANRRRGRQRLDPGRYIDVGRRWDERTVFENSLVILMMSVWETTRQGKNPIWSEYALPDDNISRANIITSAQYIFSHLPADSVPLHHARGIRILPSILLSKPHSDAAGLDCFRNVLNPPRGACIWDLLPIGAPILIFPPWVHALRHVRDEATRVSHHHHSIPDVCSADSRHRLIELY